MGFFSADPVDDALFGTLVRTGGRWIGSLSLPPHGGVELRLDVAWDEAHTLGVRIKGGALVELCGSVGH